MYILTRAYLGKSVQSRSARRSAKCVHYRHNASEGVGLVYRVHSPRATWKLCHQPILRSPIQSRSCSSSSPSLSRPSPGLEFSRQPSGAKRQKLDNHYFSLARKGSRRNAINPSMTGIIGPVFCIENEIMRRGITRLRPGSRTERMRIHRYVIIHVLNRWVFESRHSY